MSDETNRAVQPPTHAATAVIYGDDASGMKNQASRRRVCASEGRPLWLTDQPCSSTTTIRKPRFSRNRVQWLRTSMTGRPLNEDDRLCKETFQEHPSGSDCHFELTTVCLIHRCL